MGPRDGFCQSGADVLDLDPVPFLDAAYQVIRFSKQEIGVDRENREIGADARREIDKYHSFDPATRGHADFGFEFLRRPDEQVFRGPSLGESFDCS